MSLTKSAAKKKAAKKKIKKLTAKTTKTVSAVSRKKATNPPAKKTKGALVSAKAGKASSAFKEKKIIVNSEAKETIQKIELDKKPRKTSKKRALITLPPPPNIEVSNFPKNKVKTLLISQPKPVEGQPNAYLDLANKYRLDITFRQFIQIVGLTSQEFRLQRVDILAHGAVILTSKLAVDHYFRMCNEMRITVPETMKYLCINEQTAYYLQKYIQYRKRKISFGHGTILDLVDVIKKNRGEKFLLPVSDVHKEQIADILDKINITYTKTIFYKTLSANLKDIKSLANYDVLVFFTPAGIKSLKQNFPTFKQGNIRIAAFGHATAQMVEALGYRLDIFAPNPQNPSMTAALEAYIKEANKR